MKSLENASLIVSGDEENRTWKVGYISDSEEEEVTDGGDDAPATSELDQLFSSMNAANTNLMKLSIIIRNFPFRDDYLKAASRYNFDPRYDIGHVRQKYGPSEGNKEWFQERLGKSITRRRQSLKYREDHHGKLIMDWETNVEDEKQPEKTIALTKATTYVKSKVLPQETSEIEAESFGSQTSYEQTIIGEGAEKKLTVPPPPKMAFEGIPFEYGESFQFPSCYTTQIVKNKVAWKKHIFRDLKPYVCTFKECNMKMFRSPNEWFTHELQDHRRQWLCVLCATPFTNKTSFLNHLGSVHHVSESDPQLSALVLQSEEPVESISATACPLCDEWEENILDPKQDSKRAFLNQGQDVKPYGTLKHFRRHLGRHMEQLALFALPMAESEESKEFEYKDADGEETAGTDESGSDLEKSPSNSLRSPRPNTGFACPFHKYDSQYYNENEIHKPRSRYRACGMEWPDLGRLKEHIYRVHKSVSADALEKLMRRTRRRLTEVERWYEIWNWIFSDEEHPSSPYFIT